MYTYELTDGGFVIRIDNELYYTQSCRPGVAGLEPMEPAEAEAMAQQLVSDWQARDFDPYAVPEPGSPAEVALRVGGSTQ